MTQILPLDQSPIYGCALFLFEWGMSANKLPNDKLLISIVDDDESVRKALGRLLSSLDFHAETFDSGQDFLDSLADRWPDFLVLDLHMPGLSGLDVLQQLSRTSYRCESLSSPPTTSRRRRRNAWPPVPWPIFASRWTNRCSWVQSEQQRVTTRGPGARERLPPTAIKAACARPRRAEGCVPAGLLTAEAHSLFIAPIFQPSLVSHIFHVLAPRSPPADVEKSVARQRIPSLINVFVGVTVPEA